MNTQESLYSGAEIVFNTLEYLNIKEVFGYPGGAAIPLYDELARRKKTIKHYLTAHEQGAIHSAEGYAKSNEKIGVVFTTSGPGATNIVTGLANAYADSTPILAITSNVNSKFIGTNAFQEVDICKITQCITKKNYFVNKIENLQKVLLEAYYEANNGRKGPVLVDITTDLYKQKCQLIDFKKIETEILNQNIIQEKNNNNNKYNFNELLTLISKSQKPIFYCGGGIKSNSFELLYKVVKLTGFPIATTMNGLGVYPAYEKENLQMLGMHGSYEANMALYNCDLMITIGARFDDRVTLAVNKFSPNSVKVHIDIDKKELNKVVKVDYPINMDCYDFLNQFYGALNENKDKIPNIKSWWNEIEEYRKVKSFCYLQKKNKTIKPQFVLETLNNLIKKDNINNKKTFYTTDVGQHQVWATQYLKVNDKRCFITSGGLGTMGFGLPSAIGAQLANKEDNVILITGDGSFIMTMHEMATIKRYNIPVKIIILNNTRLGMVKQWQELFYHKNYSETNLENSNPNFVKNAKSFNIKAKKITKASEVKKALIKMLNSKRAYLLEIYVDPDENVYPMIPVGKGHNEIILFQDC